MNAGVLSGTQRKVSFKTFHLIILFSFFSLYLFISCSVFHFCFFSHLLFLRFYSKCSRLLCAFHKIPGFSQFLAWFFKCNVVFMMSGCGHFFLCPRALFCFSTEEKGFLECRGDRLLLSLYFSVVSLFILHLFTNYLFICLLTRQKTLISG